MYLSYDEYQEYGGTLEEIAFQEFEFEARTVIDWWTFKRLQNEQEYPEAVKRCMYKLIKLIDDRIKVLRVDGAETGSLKQAGLSGESNDGVSATYNVLSAKDAVETLKGEMTSIIQMYLQGIKNSLGQSLLYRGVYPNE